MITTDCADDDDDNDDSDEDMHSVTNDEPSERNVFQDDFHADSIKNFGGRCGVTNSAFYEHPARIESQNRKDFSFEGRACNRMMASKKERKEKKGNLQKKGNRQPVLPLLGKVFIPLTSQLSFGGGSYIDNHSIVPLIKSHGIASSWSAPSSPGHSNFGVDFGCVSAPDSAADKAEIEDGEKTEKNGIQNSTHEDIYRDDKKYRIPASDGKLQENGVGSNFSHAMMPPFFDNEKTAKKNEISRWSTCNGAKSPNFEDGTALQDTSSDKSKIRRKQSLQKKNRK